MGAMGAGISRAFRAMRACAVATALLVAVGLGGCAHTTPSLDEVERERVECAVSPEGLVESGVLTVAMDTASAPQAMTANDGTPGGYYADIARAIARDLGLDLKVVPGASACTTVGEGKADIFIGALQSESDDEIAVTGSILDNAPALFAMAEGGALGALDAESLSDATIAVQDSSASQDALKRAGIDAQQRTFLNVNECFEALAAGDVDYVACDATAGSYLSRAYEDATFAGTIGEVSSWGIALANDGGELNRVFPEVFERITGDGTVLAIHRGWYGELPMTLTDTLLEGIDLTVLMGDDEDEKADEGVSADSASGDAAAS